MAFSFWLNLEHGSAGDITIIAGKTIQVSNSAIRSSTLSSGNGGNVSLSTGTLALTNNGEIRSFTSGAGNGGSVQIKASDSITVTFTGSLGGFDDTNISSHSSFGAAADSGPIILEAPTVTIQGEDISLWKYSNGDYKS